MYGNAEESPFPLPVRQSRRSHRGEQFRETYGRMQTKFLIVLGGVYHRRTNQRQGSYADDERASELARPGQNRKQPAKPGNNCDDKSDSPWIPPEDITRRNDRANRVIGLEA